MAPDEICFLFTKFAEHSGSVGRKQCYIYEKGDFRVAVWSLTAGEVTIFLEQDTLSAA